MLHFLQFFLPLMIIPMATFWAQVFGAPPLLVVYFEIDCPSFLTNWTIESSIIRFVFVKAFLVAEWLHRFIRKIKTC